MYQKRFDSTNTRGRGRSSSSGPRRFTRNAPARKSFRGDFIDPSRFVNTAVKTEPADVHVPEHAFSDFEIHPRLKEEIVKKGYVTPTPIQDQTIPHIIAGEDVVGIADTGTGKTAAFLIPLINKAVSSQDERVLIVVPTRELALQIEGELRSLTSGSGIYSVVCVGGAGIGAQIARLRFDNQFIIGTPGRLKDLIERGKIDLSRFSTIVLDEADRMLDMGFVNDMRYLMAGMPADRQTLLFSATISPTIKKLIGEFLRSPIHISVKTRDTSQNVEQDVIRVGRGGDKLEVLSDLLTRKEFTKVLVFGRTKHGVEKLAKALSAKGFKAESIHGNKTHSNRQRALGAFKESRLQVLVATDVAARGLDIPDVSHVINFDLPSTYDDYVHRIGRTGRGEKQGKALTFVE